MNNIYELYGRLAERHAELVEYHQRTQQVLTDLAAGKVSPVQLVVDEKGWTLKDKDEADVQAPL